MKLLNKLKARLMSQPRKLSFFSYIFLIMGLLFNASQFALVSGLSEEQKNMYNQNVLYYDIDACTSEGSFDVSGISGGGIYQSGLEPPYILEQWAIHTLKAIAKKTGKSEKDTVTKEHIIALIAFAIGEGGDIANGSIFNPLNTGLNAPELIDGGQNNSGLQSFKSFDAGVEAAARTMVGSNQNRLAKVLTDPNSTATDFMKALTYYKRYPGNKFWAQASDGNPDGYYQGRLALVSTVRKNYADNASYIIGTSAKEQKEGKRDESKLVFDDGSGLEDPGGLAEVGAGCKCSAQGDDSDVLAGSDNAEKAFNFLVGKGLSAIEAAGIVGNLMQESTPKVDPFSTNSSGHTGIAQWDSRDRWPRLVKWAEEQGKKPRSLLTQLEYLYIESGYVKAYQKEKITSLDKAVERWEAIFERSGGSEMGKRKTYAREIYDKYGKNAPATGGTQAPQPCPGANGEAFILGDYAWPVDIKKAEYAGTPLPCNSDACHHDGTAAFDMSTKKANSGQHPDAVGRATFAISEGTISNLKIYMGVEGCYSFQLKAKDGYSYWYGHVRSPAVKNGDKVTIGKKLAEIGESKCSAKGNKTLPHLHIDRGSPKGALGGLQGSRDAGINDIMNALYEKLP